MEDNPFGLTELQLRRIRKYVDDDYIPVRVRKRPPKPHKEWVWVCNICGKTGNGAKYYHNAHSYVRWHCRIEHEANYDYQVQKRSAASMPIVPLSRECYGKFDVGHRFCLRTCTLRKKCAIKSGVEL